MQQIKLLPNFLNSALVEQVILGGSLLSNLHKYLSENATSSLLDLHPIQVIEYKNKGFYCVGGLRTLSVIRNCYLPSAVIPAVLLPRMKEAAAYKKCLTDILLTACLSFRTPETRQLMGRKKKCDNDIDAEVPKNPFVRIELFPGFVPTQETIDYVNARSGEWPPKRWQKKKPGQDEE